MRKRLFIYRKQPLSVSRQDLAIVSSLERDILHKRLHRLIGSQAELVVEGGCTAVAVLAALPEGSCVIAQEGCALHLALVFQDGVALGPEFFGADGNGHLDVLDFPFGPGTAVHPDAAIFQPLGNGIVDETVLDKLKLTIRSLIDSPVGASKDLLGL